MNPEDYLLKCPNCGEQSNVDPAFLQPESPMPYCRECDQPLLQASVKQDERPEKKFTVAENVNARILKSWEEHAKREIKRWIDDDSFKDWIMQNILNKDEYAPGPFTRFLYWFAWRCETGWGVMVDFNEYKQRIFLVDRYYKWMHKLRDQIIESKS